MHNHPSHHDDIMAMAYMMPKTQELACISLTTPGGFGAGQVPLMDALIISYYAQCALLYTIDNWDVNRDERADAWGITINLASGELLISAASIPAPQHTRPQRWRRPRRCCAHCVGHSNVPSPC